MIVNSKETIKELIILEVYRFGDDDFFNVRWEKNKARSSLDELLGSEKLIADTYDGWVKDFVSDELNLTINIQELQLKNQQGETILSAPLYDSNAISELIKEFIRTEIIHCESYWLEEAEEEISRDLSQNTKVNKLVINLVNCSKESLYDLWDVVERYCKENNIETYGNTLDGGTDLII